MAKRAEKGSGTYYREKSSGRFVWRGWTENEYGVRKRKKITAATNEELVERVKKYKNCVKNKNISPEIIVADFVDRFIEGEKHTLKPKTLLGYRQILKHFVIPQFGTIKVKAFADEPAYVLQDWWTRLLDINKYSLQTVLILIITIKI